MRTLSNRSSTAAQADPRIVLLTGDHGYALFDEFRRVCPSQYINAGVAEQNMVGVAAGLAKGGFRPIVYGLSAFVPVRVLEQIKLDVCYEHLPVVFIGDGAGVVYGTSVEPSKHRGRCGAAGAAAHAILSPADAHEMTACMDLALATESPVYLRMGKADLGDRASRTPRIDLGQPCCSSRRATGRLPGSPPVRWSNTALAAADGGPAAPCGACRA